MWHKTSSSRLASEFIQLPRYLKVSTFFSTFSSMVMLGGGQAVFGVSCINTSVSEVLCFYLFYVHTMEVNAHNFAYIDIVEQAAHTWSLK